MIKVFSIEEQKFIESEFTGKEVADTWFCIENPSEEEVNTICDLFDLPRDFMEDPLDEDESSRLETADNANLMIIQTPYYDEEDEYIKFKTLPLGIILTKNNIITVSARKNDVLQNFYSGKFSKFKIENIHSFVLKVIEITIKLFLRYIKKISNITHRIEYRLEKDMDNSGLMDFLDIQKSIVYFTTALRSNDSILEKLQRSRLVKTSEANEEHLQDIIVDNRQALEMSQIHSDLLKSSMDAFASLISNNLNKVMKFLTSITIILSIPTLVASIYGMNVELPFARSPHAFLITMLISLGLSAIGVFIFINRRWF